MQKTPMKMRLNQYIARATGLSRRAADSAIAEKRVDINQTEAGLGNIITEADVVRLDGKELSLPATYTTILLNKPVGYVSSRKQQGTQPTMYSLLPKNLHHLKPAGRLDADSSGLMVLTNDGDKAYRLSHPSNLKSKLYHVELDRTVNRGDLDRLESGVQLSDGASKARVKKAKANQVLLELEEGRNRQIRRTFGELGYRVVKLHRLSVGELELGSLKPGAWRKLTSEDLSKI